MQLRPTGSFYYDYTEEFENRAPAAATVPEPICPIPQRSDSVTRPLVLRQEVEEAVNAETICGTPESVLRQSGESDGIISSNYPANRESYEEQCNCPVVHGTSDSTEEKPELPFESLYTVLKQNEEAVALPEGAVKTPVRIQKAIKADVDQPLEALQTPSPPKNTGLEASTPIDKILPDAQQLVDAGAARYLSNTWAGETAHTKNTTTQRESHASLSRLRSSLDPALAEFASIFASFDRLARSPFSKVGDETYMSASLPDVKRGKKWARKPLSGKAPENDASCVGSLAAEKKSYRKQHRRNHATSKAGTGDETTTLLDETLTEVGRLVTKSNQPQLMKPLPPLPDEAGIGNEKGSTTKECEIDYNRSGLPRLRLRTKASPSAESWECPTSQASNEEGPAVPPKTTSPAKKPKLRLKLSRAHLDIDSSGKFATVVRSPGLKQCNALAEFQHCVRNDLFSSQTAVSDAFAPPTTDPVEDGVISVLGGNPTRDPGISPQPSDQFDIPYPPTLANVLPAPPVTPCNLQDRNQSVTFEREGRNHGSEGRDHTRLRHKISILRLRIAGSHLARQGRSIDTAPLFDTKGFSTPSLRGFEVDVGSSTSPEKDAPSMHRNDRMGGNSGRVKRWANNAKRAVRSYVKRTLDRNSRSSH